MFMSGLILCLYPMRSCLQTLKGFILYAWLNSKSKEERNETLQKVVKLLVDDVIKVRPTFIANDNTFAEIIMPRCWCNPGGRTLVLCNDIANTHLLSFDAVSYKTKFYISRLESLALLSFLSDAAALHV